jgi:hypothetical protein
VTTASTAARVWLQAAAALVAFLAGAATPLAAQGVGGAANREKQRRDTRRDGEPRPAKVFTDEDLAAAKAAGAPEASDGTEAAGDTTDPQAAQSPDAEPVPGDLLERERQERARLQADWRIRFANAREQLANAESASWRDVVRTEFQAGIPVPMRIKEQIETPELKRARQQLQDLEEAFRRTGLPAGWARPAP